MRKILYFLALQACFVCFGTAAFAHQSILENDTLVCPGTQLTLHGVPAINVPLTVDDQYSTVIPIGFNFTFYGNTYNKCIVSSNGYIKFDTGQAGQFSQWAISTGLPGNTDVLNSICGHYADIYPFAGGTIDYAVIGQAPFRKFLVNFCNVPMYQCNSLLTTFQIALNEVDNSIEVHLRDKPLCSTWNSGAGIEGIQDATGTNATVVPGRNYPGTWTATNSSHRFSPTSTTSYSVASIPFAPYASNGGSYTWYVNSINSTPFAFTQNITITAATGITTYYLRAIHCSDTTYDSVKVTGAGGAHLDSLHKSNPTQCGLSNGYIILYGMTPNHLYTLNYSKNGVVVPATTMYTNALGQILIANLGAGIYSNIFVTDAPCISNPLGPVTLTNPSLSAAYSYVIKYGCSQDTVVFINQSQTPGPLAYKWTFGDGASDTAKNPVHIYSTQGTYNVRLIATNGSCADTIAKNINLVHPIHASFTVSKDSACSQQLVAFTNTSTATTGNNIAPQYFWDFGDGTTSNLQSPAHAYNYAGTYNARLVVKNFVPCYDTAYHTIVIDSIPFIGFTIADTSLCAGHQTLFTGSFLSIGNTGYEWSFSDGGHIVNTNPVLHSFDSAGTQYIKLTAHYRLCPDTSYNATVTVHAYPNINLGADTAICPGAPGIPLYDHLSTPGGTYLWNTGATTSGITATMPGTYSATVTSFGCATSDTVLVLNDCYINIPNAFTANGDGNNDYFFPRQLLSRSVKSFRMDIYNRYGELIYSTTALDGRGWDGKFNNKMQSEGVYVYIIDVLFSNGHSEHHQGNVTLLK